MEWKEETGIYINCVAMNLVHRGGQLHITKMFRPEALHFVRVPVSSTLWTIGRRTKADQTSYRKPVLQLSVTPQRPKQGKWLGWLTVTRKLPQWKFRSSSPHAHRSNVVQSAVHI